MLNSWKKSTLPMPKRMQDLDLSLEFVQQGQSASKSIKTLTSGSKIAVKPMRTADFLKLFDFDSSPVVTKARKQLWSVSKSGSKKHNEQIKIKASKENIRKSIFPKTSRRTSTVKTNPADQTLPLIDMEDLEENPRKLKQPLRIPQSTVNNKTTTNLSAKRQTMYQSKLVKPAVKPGSGTKSNSVNNSAKPVGQSKLKRQTVHQSYALKSIPEITITKCNDTDDKSLSGTVRETESESVHVVLKQILSRMDKLEMLIQENHRCSKCHCVVSPCKQEKTEETAQENVKSRENNTVDFIENIAKCNNKIVENIITDTTESIKQTDSNVAEKVTDNTVSEIKNNIENIEKVTQIANKLLENVERDTKYNKNCVQNLFPIFTCSIEEITGDLNAENNLTNNKTLQNENLTKPTELIEEKDTDLCANLTLRNATSENILHKSHFELLEDQLQNNSLTSLAFIDSDDCGSPVFQGFDYDYLLGEKDGDITEINTVNRATTDSAKEIRSSTDSNDAIRTYNEMRKCIPMLCTPKISRNNNASLMTPSVQNSHKKILSRRIQEQLLMLNKKS